MQEKRKKNHVRQGSINKWVYKERQRRGGKGKKGGKQRRGSEKKKKDHKWRTKERSKIESTLDRGR